MLAQTLPRVRLTVSIVLLVFAGTACTGGDHRPAPPATAEPAPPVAVTPAEDRGKQTGADAAAASADTSALGHVDGGDAERAASRRGHESAGEPAPGATPGSGG